MPQYCCVPGCRNFGGHTFPSNPELNMKWRVAVRRSEIGSKKLWKPKRWDVVCSSHFLHSDFRPVSLLGERRILKDNIIPTVFDFRPPSYSKFSTSRDDRLKQRTSSSATTVTDPLATHTVTVDSLDVAEIEIGLQIDSEDQSIDQEEQKSADAGVQCLITSANNFSIEYFRTDSKAIQYYTGFDDFDHFMLFFNILGPAASDLSYTCFLLSPINQLFLTLLKLRQAKEDRELSILFHVSESTVCRLVSTWINFIYFQLHEIDIWPSRSVIDDTMPCSFKSKFPSTRVILDATETPIQKPSNIKDQSATYSTYKSRNTLKTMVGCTPRGLVSYISDSYGGCTSDRQIIERSELCIPGKFRKKDSIMADRGIMVQDIFASKDVYVNTPTMLKGKSQLEPHEVVNDRRVASARVHVERVIGLAKSYKILKQELPPTKVHMGSRIVYVCFMLSNFRKSIVNRQV